MGNAGGRRRVAHTLTTPDNEGTGYVIGLRLENQTEVLKGVGGGYSAMTTKACPGSDRSGFAEFDSLMKLVDPGVSDKHFQYRNARFRCFGVYGIEQTGICVPYNLLDKKGSIKTRRPVSA